MATRVVVSITHFDPSREDFSAYYERVEQYFIANEIAEEKTMLAIFLTVVGPSTYQVLKDLLSPETPSSKKLVDLYKVLKKHYEPKRLVIAERFRFHRRSQAKDETTVQYMAELRKLAKSCAFKAFLDEALRDQFVCGLRNPTIQNVIRS